MDGAPFPLSDTIIYAGEEQGFEQNFFQQLKIQWEFYISRNPSQMRGYGWRIWYPDGRILTSIDAAWKDVPTGMIGGVVYLGTARRILQGRDPFYLENGLPRSVPAIGVPSDALWPKEGIWVDDEVIRAWRQIAILSFSL